MTKKDSVESATYDIIFLQLPFLGVFSGFSGSDPDILAVPDSGKKV